MTQLSVSIIHDGVEIDKLTTLEQNVMEHALMAEFIYTTRRVKILNAEESDTTEYLVNCEMDYLQALFNVIYHLGGGKPQVIGDSSIFIGKLPIMETSLLSLKRATQACIDNKDAIKIVPGLPPCAPQFIQTSLRRVLEFVNKAWALK